jgi:diadenosine tetraphosphate (Ap4A) HIT family hydrolase
VTNLDQLWAGWRSDFISGAYGGGAKDGAGPDPCVFCRILASGLPDDVAHILWRHPSGRAFAILNAYPYTTGHLMVMPTRHVADVEDLTPEEAGDVWEGVRAAVRAVKEAYKPEGVNLGANLGKAAGAGVPGHFHMHVLPRWVGDTSFMTAIADARVLPEPLSETAAKLRESWAQVPTSPKAGPQK